jgi:Zinc finger, C3HC4 type (RING finger)
MEILSNNTVLGTSNMSSEDLYNTMTWNTTTLANTTTTTSDNISSDSNDIVGTIWNYFFGMLLLICVYFCCRPTRTPYLNEDMRRLRILRLSRRIRQRDEKPKTRIQTDMDYRYQMILESLIIQKVICSNDANGNVILGNVNDVIEVDVTHEETAITDEFDESCCCAICLEPYQVGDVVAWSRNSHAENTNAEVLEHCEDECDNVALHSDLSTDDPHYNHPSKSTKCLHVFHQDCIIQWMQDIRHDDCPSCRSVILNAPEEQEIEEIDSNGGKKTRDDVTVQLSDNGNSFDSDDGSVMQQDSQSSANTTSSMFMIVQGLIKKKIKKACTDKRTFQIHHQHNDKLDNVFRHRVGQFTDKDYILMEQGSSDQEDADEEGDAKVGIMPVGESMDTYPFRRSFSFGSYYKRVSSYLVLPPKTISVSQSSSHLHEPTLRIKQHCWHPSSKASFVIKQQSGREMCHNRHHFDKIPFRRIVSAGPGTTITSSRDSHCLVKSKSRYSNDVTKTVNKTTTEPTTKSLIASIGLADDCSYDDDEEDNILHTTE